MNMMEGMTLYECRRWEQHCINMGKTLYELEVGTTLYGQKGNNII